MTPDELTAAYAAAKPPARRIVEHILRSTHRIHIDRHHEVMGLGTPTEGDWA